MKGGAEIETSPDLHVTDFDCVEDVLLLGSSFLETQDLLQRVSAVVAPKELKTSIEKTKRVTKGESHHL